MADSPEEIEAHIKKYWMVGGILVLGTLLTVAVAKIKFFDLGGPGLTWEDIVLGLAIATTKTSFVVLIFMHMNNEKSLIYKVLMFTIVFVIGLFFLSYLAYVDPAVYDNFWNNE